MKAQANREFLIRRMKELEALRLDCRNCQGTCCTFEANSMLLTPLEAMDLYQYLKSNDLLTKNLKHKLQEAVTTYRLEPKFFNSRSYLRKSYTCPFFNHGELGCPLPLEVKPFGCLAFNSHDQLKKASSECFSETDLLEKRENDNAHEAKLNDEMRSELNLFWEKAPIPNAVLELWDKLNGDDPQPD